MKWISFLTALTFLSLKGSNAQVPLGNHTIQSGADPSSDSSNPWIQAIAPGTDVELAFPFQGTPNPKTISWTISDVGNGQYTIFNDPAGYVTFVNGSNIILIFTDPSTPTAWTLTPVNVEGFGDNLYTFSAPVSPIPNSEIVWWTKHDSTGLLFADFTDDRSDSPINRWWRIA